MSDQNVLEMSQAELLELSAELEEQYLEFKNRGVKLDMSRGRPAAAQLDIAQGAAAGVDNYIGCNKFDYRNYGLKIANRIGIAEVAAEKHTVTILDFHQLRLKVNSIQIEEYFLITVKFNIIRFRLDVQFRFIDRLLLLTRSHDEQKEQG